MLKKSILIFLIALFKVTGSSATEYPKTRPKVQLAFVELPFNSSRSFAESFPGMQQSLHLSTSTYEFAHWLIDQHANTTEPVKDLITIGFDAIYDVLPFGSAWLHEEWHRAVLSHRGLSSYNDVYKLRIGASTIAVSHIDDEALANFKRDFPVEHIRMSSAGIESQIAQNLEFEKRIFFVGNPSRSWASLWINTVSTFSYLQLCASSDADLRTDEMNANEKTIAERDFTGFDCTAWAYDLNRPFDDYSARGLHPTGTGYDRYIRWSDLNTDEQRFLKRQSYLHSLNFFNPFLFRRDQFAFGESFYNWNLQHQLAPFGYQLALHTFFRGQQTFHLAFQQNFNSSRNFPAIDFTLYSWEKSWIPPYLKISPRVALWQQPKDLLFHSTEFRWGGFILLKTEIATSKTCQPYNEFWVKSEGWLPGVVELESGWGDTFGCTWSL